MMALSMLSLLWSMHKNTVADYTTLERLMAFEQMTGSRAFTASYMGDNIPPPRNTGSTTFLVPMPPPTDAPAHPSHTHTHASGHAMAGDGVGVGAGAGVASGGAAAPANGTRVETKTPPTNAKPGLMEMLHDAVEKWKRVEALADERRTRPTGSLEAYKAAFGHTRPIWLWWLPVRLHYGDPCPPPIRAPSCSHRADLAEVRSTR